MIQKYNENTTMYTIVTLLSLIIYMGCIVMANEYSIYTLVNVLIQAILSLILVYFYNKGYDLVIYGAYLILFIVLLTFIQEYALLVVISLLSLLSIICIKKIMNNPQDYEVY